MKRLKLLGVIVGIFAVVLIACFPMLAEDMDKSKIGINQIPVTGTYEYWTDGDFQWQKFGKKIIAEGKAEAEANRLKVQAGLTPQEAAEWKYKTTVGVAEALSKSKIKWVPDVMLGNNGNGNSAMDAVGLKMVMDIADKLSNSGK